MMKRLIAMLLCCLFALSPALADLYVYEEIGEDGMPLRRQYLFDPSEIPAPLQAVFDKNNTFTTNLYHGAAIENLTNHSLSALLLLNAGDGKQLIGLYKAPDQPWQVTSLTSFLRIQSGLGLGLRTIEPDDITSHLTVAYWKDQSCFDLFSIRDGRWEILAHITNHPKKQISMTELGLLYQDDEGNCLYPCVRRFFLDEMTSIQDFPTTQSACIALSAE